ncbi:MAG: hypothetical protein AB7F43_05840 [Bacteriovoracia bacterium]
MSSKTEKPKDLLPVVLVTPYGDTVRKLKGFFEKDSERIVVYESALNAALYTAAQNIPCLLIINILEAGDFVKVINTLKPAKKYLKGNQIRFIVFSKINNAAIIRVLESFGCQEYVIEPIPEKSLTFKIGLHTKALIGMRKQARDAAAAKEEFLKKGAALKKEKGITEEEDSTQEQKEISKKSGSALGDDVWVFKKNKPTRQGGKWTIRMKGPNPEQGEWKEEKTEDGQTQWRFLDKEKEEQKKDGSPDAPPGPDGQTASQEGSKEGWVWNGDKPSFKDGEWTFQGKEPKLSYVDKDGKEEGSKIEATPEGLVMAEDSPEALEKDQLRDQEEKEIRAAKTKQIREGGGVGLAAGKKKSDIDKLGEESSSQTDSASSDERSPKASNAGSQSSENKFDSKSEESSNEDTPQAQDSVSRNFMKKKKNNPLGDDAQQDTQDSDSAKPGADAKASGEDRDSKKENLFDANSEPKKEIKKPATVAEKQQQLKEKAEALTKERQEKLKKIEEEKVKKQEEAKANANANEEVNRNPFQKKKKTVEQVIEKKEDLKAAESASEQSGGESKKQEEQSPPEVRNLIKPDEQNEIGGKDDAKTEKFNNSDWTAHDLSPEERMNLKEREERQKKLKEKGNIGGFGESNLSDKEKAEKELAEEEERKRRNPFSKQDIQAKKKKRRDDDGDSISLDEEDDSSLGDGKEIEKAEEAAEGAWSKHASGADVKRQWGARDSDQSEESSQGDAFVELDGDSKNFAKRKKAEEEVFEIPVADLGDETSTWELSSGEDYVFVPAGVRLREFNSLVEIPNWWIFSGPRPLFLQKSKSWRFSQKKPTSVKGFDKLPVGIQEYLKSIWNPKVSFEEKEQVAGSVELGTEEFDVSNYPDVKTPLGLLICAADYKNHGQGKVYDVVTGVLAKRFSGSNVTIYLSKAAGLKVLFSTKKEYPKDIVRPELLSGSENINLVLKTTHLQADSSGAMFCPVKNNKGMLTGILAVEPKDTKAATVDLKFVQTAARVLWTDLEDDELMSA